jgi:membrane fusion protein, multidrug efflux system
MKLQFKDAWALGLFFCLMSLTGCMKKPDAAPPAPPPTVTVSKPVARDVVDNADFTGRTDAPFFTKILPRVTGYLVGMPFKEGSIVKKDQVLFEIDDRPYKAALDLAKGNMEVAKASLIKSQADYDIGLAVQKQSKEAISVQELTKRLGTRDEAQGNVEKAKGDLENAQLNFDWCKVKSPIEGQVSRYDLTLGNLVNQNATVLTTVVSQDPMWVYFDVDENTMLYVKRKIIMPSKVDLLTEKGGIPVFMGLEDEKSEFPHKGSIDFGNNVVNPSTGTITLRGVFDNPANTVGKRMLLPGMFVRVRLPLGKLHPALLVDEKALGTDQDKKFVYVVNSENKVTSKRVTLGPLQEDGLRVVEGLKPDDLVITDGLQLVRPDQLVKMDQVPMTGNKNKETTDKSQAPPKEDADKK